MAFGISASVRGADDLQRLALAVKLTGDGQLRKDLLRGIRLAAKPVAEAIKDEARDSLPKTGGLNEWVASASIAPRTRTSGKSAGVRITGRKTGHDLEAVNRGEVRHPVYGGPGWSTTQVEPGFWDRGGESKKTTVQADLKEVLDATAARIARST